MVSSWKHNRIILSLIRSLFPPVSVTRHLPGSIALIRPIFVFAIHPHTSSCPHRIHPTWPVSRKPRGGHGTTPSLCVEASGAWPCIVDPIQIMGIHGSVPRTDSITRQTERCHGFTVWSNGGRKKKCAFPKWRTEFMEGASRGSEYHSNVGFVWVESPKILVRPAGRIRGASNTTMERKECFGIVPMGNRLASEHLPPGSIDSLTRARIDRQSPRGGGTRRRTDASASRHDRRNGGQRVPHTHTSDKDPMDGHQAS
jgi:hypothetical protein